MELFSYLCCDITYKLPGFYIIAPEAYKYCFLIEPLPCRKTQYALGLNNLVQIVIFAGYDHC